MTSTHDILVRGPFARTMLTNFFFFGSLNGFVLLPLYVHQLGGSEVAVGFVQGTYSAAGILCQPLVGAWVDRLGRPGRPPSGHADGHPRLRQPGRLRGIDEQEGES